MADLCDATQVQRLVREVQPNSVVHLASQRNSDLSSLLTTNVVGTANLLEALRRGVASQTRVVVVGSAAEVGSCEMEDLPLNERARCQPVDAYGISKLAQSLLVQAEWQRHGQPLIRVRLFNLIGPDLPDALLPGRCARLLAAMAHNGCRNGLDFGNLSTLRDYTDTRDVCRAIALAVEHGKGGQLYHVGTGRAELGRSIVRSLMGYAEPLIGRVECRETTNGLAGVPAQVADASLAARELGWHAEIPFEQSIEDLWQGALRDAGVNTEQSNNRTINGIT